MQKILSIILKIIIFISSFYGIYLCMNINGFMGGFNSFMYFTIQSNIWIGLTSLIGIILIIYELIKNKNITKRWMHIIKLVFTVSITLTGCVFCFVLVPTMNNDVWNITNILTHVVVPITSIIDFIIYDNYKFKYKDSLYCTIPPLCYLLFATIGYILNWNFGTTNYPYFFMNYSSPAGIFGFSNIAPYYIGSFYWIIILIIFVLGISNLYIFKKRIKK